MEQFKLKSIDELDLEFVSSLKGQDTSANKETKSLIPEISKSEPVKKSDETIGAHYFSNPVDAPVQENPIYTPMGEPEKKKARPLVPIGQRPSPYAPVGATEQPANEEVFDFSDGIFQDSSVDGEKKKSKMSGGALAGKIISIIMLCATVITFVLGCFVTIFLDNGGTDIGGVCFNTMSHDIESLGVAEGDLIISKKCDITEYQQGNLIAVPASGLTGCDIQTITSISIFSEDNASFTVTPVSSAGYPYSVQSSSCYGVISSYIPALGGILNFAMDNAILVCVLFVLLSAFWCLLLVLMERSSKSTSTPKKPKTKKEEE